MYNYYRDVYEQHLNERELHRKRFYFLFTIFISIDIFSLKFIYDLIRDVENIVHLIILYHLFFIAIFIIVIFLYKFFSILSSEVKILGLPASKEMLNYKAELEEYYMDIDSDDDFDIDENVKADFYEDVTKNLSTCSDDLFEKNVELLHDFYYCTKMLVYSISVIGITFLYLILINLIGDLV